MKVLSFTNSMMALLSAVSALALVSSGALAAIAVTSATMKSGQTLVTGTSTVGTMITLDGKYSVPISATGQFSFAIDDYHPDDCIVSLKTNHAGDAVDFAVVALCGLRGLTPRGAWLAAIPTSSTISSPIRAPAGSPRNRSRRRL